MTHDFSAQVRTIVDNYLDRVRGHLKGLPEADRKELVREIYSHIYESYAQDGTDDDIQRILTVLDRLGEPSEVVASRLSGSMKRIGRKRNLPFYILAGIFIGLFGLPLGAGGLALLIGLGITLVNSALNGGHVVVTQIGPQSSVQCQFTDQFIPREPATIAQVDHFGQGQLTCTAGRKRAFSEQGNAVVRDASLLDCGHCDTASQVGDHQVHVVQWTA